MWHTVDKASNGGGIGGGRGGERKISGRRRSAAGISKDPRRWRHRKGSEEKEGWSRRHRCVGGGGGTAADYGLRGIRDPDRGAYDLLVGRGETPVLRGACRSGGGGLSL